MAQIQVSNLSFCYEGSYDNIFENVSFSIDTNWKLGFIGRNGKGKTTFLNILLGKYEYQGSIQSSTVFDYFPYQIPKHRMERCMADFMEELKTGCEPWRVICELEKLKLSAEVLYRPFGTLSHGERTKVMLAVLFAGDNDFLFIDEPTNHLDQEARNTVKEYLRQKKGFILVSHDRDLLDACVDHVLVLNRKTIEIQNGNFSSWWENKNRKDHFAKMENEKHLREIKQLEKAAKRTRDWAEKSESTKIGFDPVKEPERCISTRAYIGAKTKKMQSRVKQYEKRIEDRIEEKEGLLQDIENPVDLKIMPLSYHKDLLIYVRDYSLQYEGTPKQVLSDFNFELHQGERIFLHGKNGCGKSSFLKALLNKGGFIESGDIMLGSVGANPKAFRSSFIESGDIMLGSGLTISYVNQDTSFLNGSLKDFCQSRDLNESLFCSVLRQLNMERVQFVKPMQEYSEGQKKKVLLAASIMTPAHVYIWDEPLNYIDVFSRIQIENLILKHQPTMILVDHDIKFQEKVATRVVEL